MSHRADRGFASQRPARRASPTFFKFGAMFVSGIKKIALAEMAKVRIQFSRNIQIIVDDQSDIRTPSNGQNRFGHRTNFIGRGFFGAELDQIRTAVAELLRNEFRRAAMQIGRVNERIKPAIGERFHGDNLTTKNTKNTKEFMDLPNTPH